MKMSFHNLTVFKQSKVTLRVTLSRFRFEVQVIKVLTARIKRSIHFFAFFLVLSACVQAQDVPVITTSHGPNSAAQQAKPYVILVSLDGFRYDYAKRCGARHLLDIAAHGASAPDGMVPVYPSWTFPNHLSIVTGLYPEHHGIVANRFYDAQRDASYSYTDPKTNSDGTWYGGTPLWVLAEQQGMRSACLFWPGSEAEIAGTRPTYYVHYDTNIPGERRVQQVLDWLKLPPEERPHLITIYFSDVDHYGHKYGPDSEETREAVHYVDEMMGQLALGVKRLNLPVDLFVVSDHGMENVQGDWINLERLAEDLKNFKSEGALMYGPDESSIEKVYAELQRNANGKFKVYRRSQMPSYLHIGNNPRFGDPIIVPSGPYVIRVRPGKDDVKPDKGNHGYDPRTMITMRSSFFAEGPDIRPGVKVPPFENVNIYPVIAKILGLQIGQIDGNISVLGGILAKPSAQSATH